MNLACALAAMKKKQDMKNCSEETKKINIEIGKGIQTLSCSTTIHVSKLNKKIEVAKERQTLANQMLGCEKIVFKIATKRWRMQNNKLIFFLPLKTCIISHVTSFSKQKLVALHSVSLKVEKSKRKKGMKGNIH